MRSAYPHTDIWINGRRVLLKDILENKTSAESDFENHTFGFISDWLSGKETFELHTSGSTGKPKTITVTSSQMRASAKLTAEVLQLQQSFNALTCLDTRYIAGKMMLVRSFESAMKIFAVDPCANPLSKIPVDQTIHFTALVPYQIKTILESKHPHLLDMLTTCIVGGAPVDESLYEKLQRVSTQVYATYGMTETISHIALQLINGKNASEHFHTLPGIQVHTDKRNCLVICAPYLEDEIVTNDLVEVFSENEFKWLGRWDNVINSGGIKVSPENLEHRIGKIFTRLKINNSFFIYGLPDESLGQKISLIIEGSVPRVSLNEVRDAMIHSFSAYEIPKDFLTIPSFIYTNTNKINRSETASAARSLHPVMR
jgi:O-succinylbenzoic acid--CoA ligase